MQDFLDYLVARLTEPSTWVSLGALFTGIGWNISPDKWQAIAGIGLGIGGFVGALLRERKKTTPAEIKAVVKETVVPSVVK